MADEEHGAASAPESRLKPQFTSASLCSPSTTLITFDSNLSPLSTSYQQGYTPGNPQFNFSWADSESFNTTDSVYYVEAQLTRTAAGVQAGLAGFLIKKIVP